VIERCSDKDRLDKPTIGDQRSVLGQRVSYTDRSNRRAGEIRLWLVLIEENARISKQDGRGGFERTSPQIPRRVTLFVRIHVVSFTHKGNNMGTAE